MKKVSRTSSWWEGVEEGESERGRNGGREKERQRKRGAGGGGEGLLAIKNKGCSLCVLK